MERIFRLLRTFKLKISIKLVLFLFINISCPILLVFCGVNQYAHKLMLEKEGENITLITEMMAEKLDDTIQTATVHIITISNENELIELLSTSTIESKVSLQWFEKKMWIEEYLAKLSMNVTTASHRITIIDMEYNIFSNIAIRMEEDEIQNIFEMAKDNYGVFIFSRMINEEDYLTACSVIRNEQQMILGIVMEDIPYSEILYNINQQYENKYCVYCIDEMGEQFLSYGELPFAYSEIGTEYKEKFFSFYRSLEEQYLRFEHKFNSNQLTIELIIPIEEIFYASQHFTQVAICLILLIIIQSIICIYIIVEWLAKPIVKISDELMDFAQKLVPIHFDRKFKSEDELGELIEQTETMSERVCALIEHEKILNEEKRRYEIAALKEQINPHMIYNTLNTITFLAQLQGIGNIEEISEAFSSLLHIQLKTNDEFVSIGKELEYIRKYVLIKKYNITADINLRIIIDELVEEHSIVPFILQPLVENSIKHGFYNRTKLCQILIRISEINHKIQIEVCDNGNGIPKEKLGELQEQLYELKDTKDSVEEHIGLINTAKRISYAYNGQSSFSIMSIEGYYTKIQIEYPLEGRYKG
ncbi:MAG: histidine kinase [Eubacteriales bacterium]